MWQEFVDRCTNDPALEVAEVGRQCCELMRLQADAYHARESGGGALVPLLLLLLLLLVVEVGGGSFSVAHVVVVVVVVVVLCAATHQSISLDAPPTRCFRSFSFIVNIL